MSAARSLRAPPGPGPQPVDLATFQALDEAGSADLSLRLASAGGAGGRFRVNVHRQRGRLAASVRALPDGRVEVVLDAPALPAPGQAESTADTWELDHLLAVHFGWWDVLVGRKKPVRPHAGGLLT